MSTHGGAVPVRGWRERFAGWTPRVVTAAGLWSLISIPLGQLGRPNIVVNRPGLVDGLIPRKGGVCQHRGDSPQPPAVTPQLSVSHGATRADATSRPRLP